MNNQNKNISSEFGEVTDDDRLHAGLCWLSWLFTALPIYAIIMSLGLAILLFKKSGKDSILSKPLEKISPGI